MFTPSRNQLPTHLRRSSTTPAQRPSTSSGEAIEPISDFLADALREKKGMLPRSQSTTPRRARTGLRSQAYQATLDEWMPSSDEERRARKGSGRPMRIRRASDMSVNKASTPGGLSLSTRETSSQMDKLQKENWDLKHRVALQQDRIKRLNEELEQALDEMDSSKELREKNEELTQALEILSKRVASSEEQMQDLTDINDELVKELESRDDGIRQRQVAIEEAAGIIQSLELKMESLQLAVPDPSPRQDSDYFSGDAEGASPQKVTQKLPPPIPQLIAAPDSDYFSADTSPNITPKTPRKMQMPAQKEKGAQLERARETGASFNREIGLRTAASRDSLFSTFLDTPDLPAPKNIGRTLRRRTPTPGLQILHQQKIPEVIKEAVKPVATPPWSNARPLRSLYEQGEFNRRIHAKTPITRMDSTPSVTIASASASTDDIFSTTNSANRSHTPATTVSDTTTAPIQPKQNPAKLTPTPITRVPTAPSPLNYAQWPRKYPDWPPSASLSSRAILFQGDGMEHMFPTSSPKDHRHLRSSSATPDEGHQVKRPPPLQRFGTTAGTPSASSRPAGLDRRRTLR